jgi:integrase
MGGLEPAHPAALGPHKLAHIARGDLQRLVGQWQVDGLSPSTIRNTLLPLRAIYRDADMLTSGAVLANPTRGLRLPAVRGRREPIAGVDEASCLLDALPARDRDLWATAFYAGLRRGELQALRWDAIDLAGGTIRVEASWDRQAGRIAPKSQAGARTVPIIGRLHDLRMTVYVLPRTPGPEKRRGLALSRRLRGRRPCSGTRRCIRRPCRHGHGRRSP